MAQIVSRIVQQVDIPRDGEQLYRQGKDEEQQYTEEKLRYRHPCHGHHHGAVILPRVRPYSSNDPGWESNEERYQHGQEEEFDAHRQAEKDISKDWSVAQDGPPPAPPHQQDEP